MVNPTVVSSATSNGNSTSPSITLPSGIQTGDLIYLVIHDGGTATLSAAPSGYSLVDGPEQAGSNTCQGWIYSKTATSADSGTAVSATLSTALRWAMMALIVRNGAFDAVTYGVAASTLTTTNNVTAFTPVANNCLAMFLMDMSSGSGVGNMATTPPTGWTEVVDFSGTTGSLDVGLYAATKQLSGQAGTLQSATTCTTNVNHRANGWVLTLAPVNAPTASFTITSQVALALSVDGTGSTAVTPATISSYDWDWGDGTTHGTGSTASHTYSAGGTYTVTLTVTDSNSHTGSTSQTVTVAPAAGTVTAQSVNVSTNWTASSGTVLSCITDGDPTTFVTSSTPPTGQEFDFTLQALTPPSTGQPLKVFLTMDALLATSATLNAQLFEGTTQRSSLTGVTIPAGSGSSVTGSVTLTFPWTDVSTITTGGWNALKVKLQVTAS